MFKSATLRLTLWYLAIVMTIAIVFSGLLYSETTRDLSKGLHSESQSIYNQFPVFQNDPNINISPNSYYRTSIHRELLRLIGFNLIVLVAAGFTSYWLARRTLTPIEAAHEQQKRFTSDVSHELRTPLTAIKMESEVALMNDKISAKELRSTLTSNLEEVGKLESLINNLLRLTRLEADELQENFVICNSKTIFENAVSKLGHKADDHKIKIEIGKSSAVLGDPDSLEQLIVILLDNALKYSPINSQITLTAKAAKDTVKWSVEDKGTGIEPEALSHVFDRFYRADSSRNKGQATEGYGLGLSIAKMITDIHNSPITITSKLTHGTTVTVTFPVIEEPKTR
jgi:two-component system sensor histidine kinase CiaH